MDTQIIVGGLAACLGLGYLLYRYSDDGLSDSATLTRDDVVRILQDLRSELMNVYIQISSFVLSIREQMGGRIPDEYIKEIIMTQTPIGDQISKVEEKVYQKNSITKESFQAACTITYASDDEVKELMDEMKKSLENSFRGVAPSFSGELPEIMTSEKTLEVFKDMNDATLLAMYDIIEDIKSQGINEQSQQFQMEFQRQSPKIEKATFKVFEKHGLDELDQPATLVIQRAIQVYSKTDFIFKQRMSTLQQGIEQKMQAAMTGRISPYEIEAIRASLEAGPKVEEIEEEPLIQELENPREVKEEEFNDEEDLLEGEVIAK
ncbi:unnamed protein product [Blepharisma stoltei]|uniref:Uncharacterized protein n=1 Tax=Blepharisma stoltei TaxID=1481888 RepID=A0AAU9JRC1_9CILI|nr:unnamed protein product [Blepharisma stoltei]